MSVTNVKKSRGGNVNKLTFVTDRLSNHDIVIKI